MIALAGVTLSSIVVGIAVAAAVDPPSRAILAADAVPIGTGLERPWYLGGFSDLYPEGASGKEFWTITDRGPNFDGGAGNGTSCVSSSRGSDPPPDH